MHYYSHNIADYRRDTAHLSLIEHGAYRQLLDMYCLTEEKIPEETEAVMRRLCARTEEEKKAVITVLNEFFQLDSGWKHEYCDEVIASYHDKADRARSNGQLGGRPAKTKPVISGLSNGTQTKANSLTQELNNSLTQELNINTNTGNEKPAKKQKPVTPSAAPFVLPDQIPADEFNAFVEMRKAAKKAMTDHAKDLLVKQLLGFAQSGYDLKSILNASILGGWSGVYEPKTKPSLPGAVSSSLGIHGQATAENAKRFIERQMQKESAGVS